MTDNGSLARPAVPQNIILEDRHSLTVSGVSDVDSFDEQSIVILTGLGELCVRGSDLHINRLSLEIGEILVEGEIDSLVYTQREAKPQGGFFSKVFR